jgi:hypothetical protein
VKRLGGAAQRISIVTALAQPPATGLDGHALDQASRASCIRSAGAVHTIRAYDRVRCGAFRCTF